MIQKMDIPNMSSQPANSNEKIGDLIKDTSKADDVQSKFKTLDSVYITMSTGLFFIFIQVNNNNKII